MLKVSIVHWNRPKECAETVRLIAQQDCCTDVTVIDNGSDVEAFKELGRLLPDEARVVRLPENVGWGAAHNRVLAEWLEDQSAGEYAIVAAHDATPAPGCIPTLIAALEANSHWGVACPQYGSPELPQYREVRGTRTVRLAEYPNEEAWREVDYAHGTLAVYRRECLAQIGLHDESFFAYGDEVEICLRARSYGWKIGLVWDAVLDNPGTWTGAELVGYLCARNSIIIAKLHGGSYAAAGRLARVLIGSARLGWSQDGAMRKLGWARLRGCRDYLTGRWGAPKRELKRREGRIKTDYSNIT